MKPDYTTVTEVTGGGMSHEQMTRMCTRYYFAANYCDGKDVLEVACGAGQGLGYLAKKARSVVGGDCTETLVECAQGHYRGRVDTPLLDAHKLPFKNDTFDVVILFEAIYYLTEQERFLDECKRILRPKGAILICMPNKEWSGFNKSPFSTRYFSASEMRSFLMQNGFDVELFGDCPIPAESVKDKLIAIIRKKAVDLHLIPKTMKGKESLKRIFFGKLTKQPAEIEEGMSQYCQPVQIKSDSSNPPYKVIFTVAHKR